MSIPPAPKRQPSKRRRHMPFSMFSGASQLEVITVIANCGTNNKMATDALIKWIESKQYKGKTEEEILAKLEVMERKFLPFEEIHVSFHIARRVTSLPVSLILLPVGTTASPSLRAPSPIPSAPSTLATKPLPLPPAPHFLVSNARPSTSGGRSGPATLDLGTPQLHSKHSRTQSMYMVPSPTATVSMDSERDLSAANPPPHVYTNDDSMIDFGQGGMDDSSSSTSPSITSPTYSEVSSITRPSSSASTNYPPTISSTRQTTLQSIPSTSSLPIGNEFRQSVLPKPDPAVVEALFSSSSPSTFLRLFRG